MRVIKGYKRFSLARGIKAFFDVEAGIGRGEIPASKNGSEGVVLAEARQRISQQRKQLQRRKDQIDQKDRRIAALQEQLVRMRSESPSGAGLEGLGEPAQTAGGGAHEGPSERPGIGLKPGDPHYRSWVGRPENYDLKAAIQVSLLLAAGLRETHKLVEVGCGSLRAGRMFIPYLLPGNYHGIEPNRWVVEEGIKNELGEGILEVKRPNFRFVDDFSAGGFGVEFDFALAQSVFSHTYPDMTLAGLKGISDALAPEGRIFANFVEGDTTTEDGSGWVYPGCTTFTWERMEGILAECNLVGRKLNWMQGMQWFVAARPDQEDAIAELARRLRPPLTNPREFRQTRPQRPA